MTAIRVDTTIAARMREAGLEPADIIAQASNDEGLLYPGDEHDDILEEILDGIDIDVINDVVFISGGGIDFSETKNAPPFFQGPWNDTEDFTSPRVDGLLPPLLVLEGVFPEDRIIEMIGKPVSALGDLAPCNTDRIADRIIRDIRNKDYRSEGGGILVHIELITSWETFEADLPSL